MIHIMDKRIITQEGRYTCIAITATEFAVIANSEELKSSIRCQKTSEIFEELTGIKIHVSKEKTSNCVCDKTLVLIKKDGANPAKKENYDLYLIKYESQEEAGYKVFYENEWT